MKYVTFGLCALTFLAYTITFSHENGMIAVLFFAPFTLLPLLGCLMMAVMLKSTPGQAIVLASVILYIAWFSFIYIDVTWLHVDANGSLMFLFVGAYAFPVLLVIWLIAGGVDFLARRSATKNVTQAA